MGSEDFRVKTGWFRHPKRRKLRRKLGDAGEVAIFALWAHASENKPTGLLDGYSEEDIADAVEWDGDPKQLVQSFIVTKLLSKTDEGYLIHDWEDHNPWAAGAEARSEAAKKAAAKRWERRTNKEPEPQKTETPKNAESNAESCTPHKSALPDDAESNADSINSQCPISISDSISNSVSKTNSVVVDITHACEAIAKGDGQGEEGTVPQPCGDTDLTPSREKRPLDELEARLSKVFGKCMFATNEYQAMGALFDIGLSPDFIVYETARMLQESKNKGEDIRSFAYFHKPLIKAFEAKQAKQEARTKEVKPIGEKHTERSSGDRQGDPNDIDERLRRRAASMRPVREDNSCGSPQSA